MQALVGLPDSVAPLGQYNASLALSLAHLQRRLAGAGPVSESLCEMVSMEAFRLSPCSYPDIIFASQPRERERTRLCLANPGSCDVWLYCYTLSNRYR